MEINTQQHKGAPIDVIQQTYSVHHIDALKVAAGNFDEENHQQDVNTSKQSNMNQSQTSLQGGGFAKLNNSLKVAQRKQEKEGPAAVHENSLIHSIEQDSSQKKKKKEGPPPPVPIAKKSGGPPPPVLKKPPPALVKKKKIKKRGDSSDEEDDSDDEGEDRNVGRSKIQIQQDMVPQMEDPFVIRVNLKENPLSTRQPPPKIPNLNDSLFNQAKYVLYQQYKNGGEQATSELNEISLNQCISRLHKTLMQQKDDDFMRQFKEQEFKTSQIQQQMTQKILQQQKLKASGAGGGVDFYQGSTSPGDLGNATQGGGNDTAQLAFDQNQHQQQQQQLEELRRLREENQELRSKSGYLESDLHYQATKVRDMQTKFESELENLRSQLKGSQSEQFVKQQGEHKKLIEDNAMLMREVKALRSQLKEEQSKVMDLFDDAQKVREELRRELTQLEKTKGKLNGGRRRHQQQSGVIDEEEEGDDSDFDKKRSNKKKNMVSRAVSRGESMISFEEESVDEINNKIEELIDQKTRSIVNVITQSQMNQYNNAYAHPYATAAHLIQSSPNAGMNISGGVGSGNGSQQPPISDLYWQGGQVIQSALKNRKNQQVIEMSINESDDRTFSSSHNLSQRDMQNQESHPNLAHQFVKSGEESKKNLTQKLNGGASSQTDLSNLKSKIKEMRDRHHTDVMNQSSSDQNIGEVVEDDSRGRGLMQGPPYYRNQFEPDRSPEDYFARQHIIHSAMKKAIKNQFYHEVNNQQHTASNQTFIARNPSLIHIDSSYKDSAVRGHDVSLASMTVVSQDPYMQQIASNPQFQHRFSATSNPVRNTPSHMIPAPQQQKMQFVISQANLQSQNQEQNSLDYSLNRYTNQDNLDHQDQRSLKSNSNHQNNKNQQHLPRQSFMNHQGFDLHNPEGSSNSGRGSNNQLPSLLINNGSNQNFDLHHQQPERFSEFSSNNFKTPAFFGGGGIPKDIMKMQDQEGRESQEDEEDEEVEEESERSEREDQE